MSDIPSSETDQKKEKQLAWVEVGAVVLVVILLALFDLVELTTLNRILQTNPVFLFIHDIHDVLALLIIFVLADRRDSQIAFKIITLFFILEVPYIILKFKEDPLEMIRLVAIISGAFYAITILKANAALRNQLKELSIKDGLTGLYNPREFNVLFRRELLLSKRESRKGALLYLDVDGFKQVNDRYGHLVGDQLLRDLAVLLLSHFRETDIVCRLGGDEFAVIMPDVDQTGAAVIADRILQTTNTEKKIAQFKVLSSSIGISFYPSDGVDAEELIRFADQAMYRAKDQGRNQYAFYVKNDSSVA